MTLHVAIEKLLRQVGRPMTTSEIADLLNKNKWYQKKDGSPIGSFQIHGRTRNYANLFSRNGTLVSIVGQSIPKTNKVQPRVIKQQKNPKQTSNETTHIEKRLMNKKLFKSVSTIDTLVPDYSGLYCIRINEPNKLPKPFNSHLKDRKHDIIYVGVATQSLSKRFLNQELRANGHGTFFRSIGAVLGYRPEKGSLMSKKNKRNYTFKESDELKIIEWINHNLKVNWVEYDGSLEELETELIRNHLPLFNIAKNPSALNELKELRAECVRIANS